MNPLNIVQIPHTINISTYNAYRTDKVRNENFSKCLNAFNLKWEVNSPKTLRLFALDAIMKSWEWFPKYFNIRNQTDRNYFLENLKVDIPIKITSKYIQDNIYWKRCFIYKWGCYPCRVGNRPWISIYMEKYLSEYLEKLDPSDYDQETVLEIVEICSPYIMELNIDHLQPLMGQQKADHISFEHILSNLPELNSLSITFNAKTIETGYFKGCCSPSRNDVLNFCRGLENCYELKEFNLHSTKIEYQLLQKISHALDKGCNNLVTLELPHCRIGERGFIYFLRSLNQDSLPNLQKLNLSNNLLSPEAALILSRTLKNRRLKCLDLSMNPIGSDGAASIFLIIERKTLEHLDVSACSLTDTIQQVLFNLIIELEALIYLDLSNNMLGHDLGENLCKLTRLNKTLKYLDLRNTEISNAHKTQIYSVIFENRDRL